MAKIVFSNNNINDIFNGSAELRIGENHTKATYADGLTGGKLVFLGTNLARDGHSEYMSGGRISQLLITDENNELAFKLTNVNISSRDLPHNYVTGDLAGLLSAMLNGKDKIVGSTDGDFLYGYGGNDRITGKVGDDFITGGRGNDTLTGGAGTDTFHFVPSEDGRGHDVITDFDVEGGIVDHLFIEPTPEIIKSVDAVHKGQDTLITLSEGSTIVLEGVRRQDLLDYFAHV